MKKIYLWLLFSLLAIITFSVSTVTVAFSASSEPMLKMAFIDNMSQLEVKKLARMGLDIAAVRKMKGAKDEVNYRIEAVLSARDEIKLKKAGIAWKEAKHSAAATGKKVMTMMAAVETPSVYHSFDEPVLGIKDQLYQIADDYPEITKLETIGYSLQGRPLLAMRLKGQKLKHKGKGHGKKGKVLYLATHHAREWAATQMAMRLIKYLTANYGNVDRVTNILSTTEVWVIPVANPDGYEYTFTNERLWRKNLRDNDGDGAITVLDGVDLNRNFDSHWGLDEEGSSSNWSDATYRGAAPDSEPETQAVVKFVKKKKFKLLISYHTYGNLILYPWGWQVKTASYDDPIFVAQAGTDDNPAIRDSLLGVGYDPGVGADLYITNGDFTDWSYHTAKIPSHTVELTYGYHEYPGEIDSFYGFVFPDDEAMVQTVFEDNLEFALAVAESAADPGHPVSPVGIIAEDVYHIPVTDSYGSEQNIDVLARKKSKLGLKYSINGGKWKKAKFKKVKGEFYNQEPGVYYEGYQAVIKGQQAGDELTYKVEKGKSEYGPYSYSVTSASGNRILVLAAEDYSGSNPEYEDTSGPNFLQYYTDALDSAGYAYDVWNVDDQGVASYSEVLSHYDVVIWYTGDDYLPTVPYGFDTLEEEVLNIREYLNYGSGKLFATGQDLAWWSAVYGWFSDDFFQYYLGAFMHIEGAGMDPGNGLPFDVKGEDGDPIFGGLNFSLNGGDSADNQCCADTFLPTSYFLPHFNHTLAARYARPGGPFDPLSGDYYVYSQLADVAFKRLGGTFMLPASSPTLKFWISYDIEADWDFAFVEIRQADTDDWTTLPDTDGLTTQNTGESCLSGWVDQIHPFLEHYMDAACSPSGTTGDWHAFTANSGGWQQVEMDLSAYAGQTVEIHISYATDWATQNLGVFVDDIELSGYPLEDFENGMGDWSVSVAPGSGAINNWMRITGAGFPEGPAIRTSYSVYLGFGFEGIDTADNRTEVMDRVMKYFGQ